ncbi:MAG: 2-C-methyl-D-erythritol 2,4-cyclodiphosphate synthase [Cyanobacteria bacterium SIG29]|nr:2-C-methyl-D-erythritol 2,4-cyclodiphosphate synthase [Cyanobacteria bacterium SIG29]
MYRIGQGFDIHKLVEGRNLILGGIKIDYEKGLLGHSDADALLHSIIDSLLGALALGDIGTHFPDNDPQYKDIDSTILLKKAYQLVKDKGYVINNLDNTIFAQAPKMKPYIPAMQENLAKILELDKSQISIKAKTMEEQDSVGEKKAISTQSIVLLRKI